MVEKKGGYWRMLAAVGLVAALACGCAGGEAVGDQEGGELSSQEGPIAFTRITNQTGMDIEADIYTIYVDGTAERKLTDTPGLDGFPSWSPDGQRIAFVSARAVGGNWEIYVMDSDGRHQRRLTNTPEDEAALAWSPDGEKIAYGTNVFFGDNPTIWGMDADGSGHRRLAEGSWPSWSPDGERIVYASGEWNDPRISVMNADRSEQRTLDIRGASEPAWSPDGELIAYVADVGPDKENWDNEEIFVMNSDGSGRTRLTDILGNDHWPPTWSPDGTRIAFTSDGKDGYGEIYVMSSDGSGLTQLTHHPSGPLEPTPLADTFPSWRP